MKDCCLPERWMPSAVHLRVRWEPFEHGLVPLPDLAFPEVGASSLAALRRKMHSYAENLQDNGRSVAMTGRINTTGIALCLGLLYEHAQGLFEALASVVPETDPLYHAAPADIDTVGASIDDLVLFLYLQNYKKPPSRSHIDAAAVADVWPLDSSSHKLSSLHVKTRKAMPFHVDEEIHQLAYVQKHLRVLLSLLADFGDPDDNDSQVLTLEQFSHLGFFIFFGDLDFVPVPLSQAVPFFSYSDAEKPSYSVPLQQAHDWLMKHFCAALDQFKESLSKKDTGPDLCDSAMVVDGSTCYLSNQHNFVSTGPIVHNCCSCEKLTFIEGVTKGSILKEDHHINGGSVKVVNCHDSAIYILAPAKYISIYGCSDSIIVLGAVGKAVRIEHCERVQLIVATVRICIANCRECLFHMAVNQIPLIYGENHSLQVAPYNTFYPGLEAHLTQVGFDQNLNKWDMQMTLGAMDPHDSFMHAAGIADTQAEGPSLLPPERFISFVIPRLSDCDAHGGLITTRNPFMLPRPYYLSQQERIKSVETLKEALRSVQTNEPRKAELSHAIRLHFKEWLYASGSIRQLYKLQKDVN